MVPWYHGIVNTCYQLVLMRHQVVGLAGIPVPPVVVVVPTVLEYYHGMAERSSYQYCNSYG